MTRFRLILAGAILVLMGGCTVDAPAQPPAAKPLMGTWHLLEQLTVEEEPETPCSISTKDGYKSISGGPIAIRLLLERDGMTSKYTGDDFRHTHPSFEGLDVEHVVAKKEADDSGYCDKDRLAKRRFATDPLNLAVASRETNRGTGGKHSSDAAEWEPPLKDSRCWFATTIIQVKAKYALSVDSKEKDALSKMLKTCPPE